MVLVGSEQQRPYLRPPLSKEYLRGETGVDKVYVHDESFYEGHGIELRTATTVERIQRLRAPARAARPRRELLLQSLLETRLVSGGADVGRR